MAINLKPPISLITPILRHLPLITHISLKRLVRTKRRKILATLLAILLLATSLRLFLNRSALAAWSPTHGDWAKRKMLTITNNSSDSLASGTTVAITVNTKGLYDTGKLQSDCDDLRILYQPSSTTYTELTRHLEYPSGTTCATSLATSVYFQLQSALSAGSSSTNYYMYFYNLNATTPSSTDDVFDVGSKDALLVCPFDGSTTCVAGETPSTESGAIRYSGSKSALSFDGINDEVDTGTSPSTFVGDGTQSFTLEGRFKLHREKSSSYWIYQKLLGSDGTTAGPCSVTWRSLITVLFTWSDNRQLYFSLPNSPTDGCQTETAVSFGQINYDTWYYFAATYDGSTKEMKTYLDGSLVNTGTWAGSSTISWNKNLFIGSGGRADTYFDGVLDEIHISDTIRYTSNFTPPTAPFVRDEHTKLLFHFDENGDDPRNTGKVIDDSGNGILGTINGAKHVAGLVGVDSSTSDTGNVSRQSYAGHEGIFIEEATTNKITNPSFDHSTYNTNWTTTCNEWYENTTAPYYKFGSKSARLITNSSTDCNTYMSINVGNTNVHTLSAYVYRGTSGNVGGTVNNTIAQIFWQASAQSTTTYTDMGGGWWRLSYTAAGVATPQQYGVTLVEDSGTIYVDGVQLEEKNYATTYTDGTLGTGYSWSGTAHESTSSRAQSRLQYGGSSNISANSGTVAFWHKRGQERSVDHQEALFRYSTNSTDYVFAYYYGQATDDLRTEFRQNNNAEVCGSSPTGVDPGEWHHYVITWTANSAGSDGCQVYHDGLASGTGDSGETWSFSPTADIGVGDNLPYNQGNNTIADFRIYDDDLTAAEVKDLYYSSLVSHQQQYEVDRFSEEKGQNPVAIWHFDESYGSTANDSSIYGNHLTVYGATWETQSVGAKARLVRNLEFDGTNDSASRSGTLREFNFGTGGFSIGGWFRHPSSQTGTDTLLSRYGSAASGPSGGYKVYMNSNGYICFGIDDDNTSFPEDSACTTTSYADSRWHHFEAVKSGTTSITLYIDGNEVASDPSLSAQNSLNSSAAIIIGADNDNDDYWTGFLDEIVVYPYARSADQIKADVFGSQNAALFGAETKDWLTDGLVGYWKMDETSGTNVADSSGNSNAGTLTNAQETGTAEADHSTTTVVADDDNSSLATANDAYNGMILRITGGTCGISVGTERVISDYVYDATPTREITVSSAFSAEADDCTFEIRHQVGGKFGKAMHFDGNNDYSYFGSPATFDLANGTIALWIMTTSYSTSEITLFDKNQGGNNLGDLGVSILQSTHQNYPNKFSLFIQTGSTSHEIHSDNVVALNEWVHLALTFGSNGMKMYVDGKLQVETDSYTGGMTNSSATLYLSSERGTNFFFDDKLDDVRVYNRALSPAEVADLYHWAPGPIGYWPMDEGTGTSTVYDRSGNGNNGTMNGSMTEDDWIPGKFGSALDFDGSNDYINGGSDSSLDDLSALTYTAWIRPDDVGDEDGIVYKSAGTNGKGFSVGNDPGPKRLDFFVDRSSVDAISSSVDNTIATGEWQHVAVTWDGTNAAQLYRNGIEVSYGTQQAGSGAIISEAWGNLTIGSREVTPIPYDGLIDEVRIYNYARTPSQIIEDMNAGHPVGGSPLPSQVGYWTFDEGYGDIAYDQTGNNNGNLGDSDTTCPASGVDCPTWTNSGKFGKALDFDGSDTTADNVNMGDPSELDITSTISITFWMKKDVANQNAGMVSKWTTGGGTDNSYTVTNGQDTANDKITFALNESSGGFPVKKLESSTSVPADVWTHITATADGLTMRLYINGVQDPVTQTYNGTIKNTAKDLVVGRLREEDTLYPFNGKIDEVKIYNVALTADQVKLDMNQGKAVVWGATSTTSSGAASFDAANEYCPPRSSGTCTPPVGEWKFDEKTGTTANDTSGNGNSGSFNGNPTWSHAGECQKGACLDFDASNDYVNIADDDIFSPSNLTLGAWIKWDGQRYSGASGKDFAAIITKGSHTSGEYTILMYRDSGSSNTNIYFYIDGTQQVSWANSEVDTSWHYLSTTYNGSSAKIFFDGIEKASANVTPTVPNSANDVRVGSTNPEGYPWGGFIDEARIYNYARSPAQIAWEYNRGGPVGYWQLDECSGSTAYDASGKGNSGTINIGSSGSNTSAGTCSSGNTSHAWYNGRNGKRNASLDFDGTDDYVNLGGSTTYGNENTFSVSLWFKTSSASKAYLYGEGYTSSNNPFLFLASGENAAGDVVFCLRDDSGGPGASACIDTGAQGYNDGNWHHLVGVQTSKSKRELYVDGISVGTATGTLGTLTLNTAHIGVWQGTYYDGYVDGQIDDVRIYNYALTQQQIRDVYNQGAVRYGPATGSP